MSQEIRGLSLEELQLSLLGKLQINRNGSPVTGFVSTKAQALLCFLAVTGRPHDRQTLATLLWGEMPEVEARTNLRTVLANLRKLLDPYLEISRDTVCFNRTTPYWLDIELFQAALTAAGLSEPKKADLTIRSEPYEPDKIFIQPLRQALELYRGDFLEGFTVREALTFEEWMVSQRERLRQSAMQGLLSLAREHTARGEYAAAIDYTGRLLALEPWREEGHRQMMTLLARSGQRSAALAQYESCRRILADELGVEPEAETEALYERLKMADTPRPHNLPPQTTPFVGREAELARIINYLENGDCRLLTLTGLGGVGKTRLALQAAAAVLPLFQDGAFLVSLALVHTQEGLISTLANALDFPLSGTQEDRLQLLNYLHSKELLLILDNFEHLLSLPASTNGENGGRGKGKRGARGEAVAGEILRVAPRVKLLVTSRERLNLQEEWVLEIEGLTFPEKDWTASDPQALELYSAVNFFIQQARRVQADFRLAKANQAEIARLCHLLQGMPLGLELAATWLPILSPAEITIEIERDLDFLTTSMWNIPDRHRSIRAVFESSWHLLSNTEREVLQGLSLFQGGFSREAAVQVTGASFSLLLGLLNKSLLRRDALGRYDMHELIRQYGAEKLAEKEGAAAALRARQAAYYLALAEQAEPELRGPNQVTWWQRLELELDNLRAALAWAVEACNPEIGLRLVAALGWFWRIRGHLTEGRAWSAQILALPYAQNQLLIRARALNAAGLLAFYQTDYATARTLYEESMRLSEAAGDRPSLAQTLHGLGDTLWYQGQAPEAISLLEQSFTIFCELEDQFEVAAVLSRLGAAAAFRGDAEAARSLSERSLTIYKTLDDKWGIVYTLWSLADAIYYTLRDYETGAALYEQGLPLAREVRDKPALLSILVSLADIALIRQDYARLEAYAQEALLLAQELGEQWQPPRMLRLLGYAALQEEDKTRAIDLFVESLRLNYKLDDRRGLLACVAALARLAYFQQQPETAVQWLSAIEAQLSRKKEQLLPADASSYEQTVALVRAEVPSEQFTRNWEQGRKLSLEPLIQQAQARYQPSRPASMG